MPFTSRWMLINRHNVRTLRQSAMAEISGSLGDLGTFLPLMIALALKGSINVTSTLIFGGLANVATGLIFGVPLPVQPMKAIAAIAVSRGFSQAETSAAGLTMGMALIFLSATRLLHLLGWIVPLPVVKGIQVGAGLSLVISAGSQLIAPLGWVTPGWDNRLMAAAAFLGFAVAYPIPRMAYALFIVFVGLVLSTTVTPEVDVDGPTFSLWKPHLVVPKAADWRVGAIDAAVPQLPLTLLNSVIAVTSLSEALFVTFPPAPTCTALGFSIGVSNLIGCWFGAMPMCHGSGGLAGQYRFGARSGASVIVLGLVKCVMGLLVGDCIVPILRRFPRSLLGIMVFGAGMELAKVGSGTTSKRDPGNEEGHNSEGEFSRRAMQLEADNDTMTMLVTASGCLAFKNDAVGFLAGLIWYWLVKWPRFKEVILGQTPNNVERERLLGAQETSDERLESGLGEECC